MDNKLNNTAPGQMAGYLFQPDRALYYLSSLKDRNHYVSVELIDDVNVHNVDGSVILTEQDKHSICQSNSTFSDTSKDLWRTLQIWISMVKSKKIILEDVDFICCTNVTISNTSIISKISECKDDSEAEKIITLLKKVQKQKQELLVKNSALNKNVPSLNSIIGIISDVLSNELILKKLFVKVRLEKEQDSETMDEQILNNISITQDNPHKTKILIQLKGWVNERCKLLMNSKMDIVITKEQFNYAVQETKDVYKLSNISFSARDTLELTIDQSEISNKESSLFVKQLDTIKHRNIKNIILDAILDFLCYEKEVVNIAKYAHITQQDFRDFTSLNKKRWEQIFNKYVVKELSDYSQTELDDFAFKIYNEILELNVKFKMYEIPISSIYFKNGCFHHLADNLQIGWHPNWEKIFEPYEIS